VKDPLFSQCPRPPSADEAASPSGWVLSARQQDAVLALGLFFLEGGFQCANEVVPYLLALAHALDKAHIQEKRDARESKDQIKAISFIVLVAMFAEIPATENFSFAMNTLLSDVSARLPAAERFKMLEAQISLLSRLAEAVETSACDQSQPVAQNTKLHLCLATLPTLFGLCRALGRFPDDDLLMSRLFPPKNAIAARNGGHTAPVGKQYSNFRPIMPRALAANGLEGRQELIPSESEDSLVDLR